MGVALSWLWRRVLVCGTVGADCCRVCVCVTDCMDCAMEHSSFNFSCAHMVVVVIVIQGGDEKHPRLPCYGTWQRRKTRKTTSVAQHLCNRCTLHLLYVIFVPGVA